VSKQRTNNTSKHDTLTSNLGFGLMEKLVCLEDFEVNPKKNGLIYPTAHRTFSLRLRDVPLVMVLNGYYDFSLYRLQIRSKSFHEETHAPLEKSSLHFF
jgi:hypothetical protein